MQKSHKHTKEAREKMRHAALQRDNTNRIVALPRGIKHWNWSEKPTILTIHKRIHRKLGKASVLKCVDCGKKARDWSNENGTEYSTNINNYKPRCRSCHVKKDRI